MTEEGLKRNFWYADWSFPIFVGIMQLPFLQERTCIMCMVWVLLTRYRLLQC